MARQGWVWQARLGKKERRNYKKMVYQWKTGSRIPAKVEDAVIVLNSLEKQGCLTASAVVEVSRPEDAVLHKCFEWNDYKAAEKYREVQARHIINSVVLIDEDSKKKEPIRAFFNIESRESNYDSIQAVIQKKDLMAELLEQARKDMDIFALKYKRLSNSSKKIKKVIEAIEEEEE